MPDPTTKLYEKALKAIQKEKGVTPEQFKKYAGYVSFAESKGDITAKQKGGGPGRGKYQFETAEGSNAGLTAYKRAIAFAKDNDIELTDEIKNLKGSKSIDFSTLSEDAQDFIFAADFRKKKRGNFKSIQNNKFEDLYLNSHYAGTPEQIEEKRQYAKEQYDAYTKTLADGGQIASVFKSGLNVASLIKMDLDKLNENPINLKQNYNPFGKMADGGNLNPAYRDIMSGKKMLAEGGSIETQGMKTYSGNSHEAGGIPINTEGEISTGNQAAEVEGNEKKYTYSNLPDKQGTNYVFPKAMKSVIEKLEKKTRYGDDIDGYTKELSLKKLEMKNEKRKMIKQLQQLSEAIPSFKEGGYPKYEEGDPLKPINPLPSLTGPAPPINPFDKNSLKPLPLDSFKQTPEPTKTIGDTNLIKGLGAAKSIFEISGALGGLGKNKEFHNENRQESESLVRDTLSFDNSSLNNKVLAQMNAAMNNFRKTGRGIGAFNANMANIQGNTVKALADIEIQKNQQLASRKQGAAQILAQLGTEDRSEKIRVDQLDQMDKAAVINTISKGMDDAISIAKFDNNLEVANMRMKEQIAILSNKYPDFVPGPVYEKLLNGTATESEIEELKDNVIQFVNTK